MSKQLSSTQKKVNFGKHVIRIYKQDGSSLEFQYETDDLKQKLENISAHYLPDFGYEN